MVTQMRPAHASATPRGSYRPDRRLLLNALRGGKTERPAWVPFVGVHGGSLIGVDATAYLKSADHIVAGLNTAIDRYRPDGLPVVFDLQMEAEVLGCDLHWAERTPPSVISHPLSTMEGPGLSLNDLPQFNLDAGRFPIALEATRRIVAQHGRDVAFYGLLTGPFTLACHLMGNDIFLEMYDNETKVHDVIALAAKVAKQVAAAYREAGCDVIAVVDPMTSQISPEHFTQFATPAVNDIFDAVRQMDALSSLFVCGDATRNLAVMSHTRCDNLSIDENISLDQLREIAKPLGKSIGGNLKLTTVLLMGDQHAAKADALRCMDACGTDGFVLAPGCDLPYDVKPANLEAVAEMVYDPYQRDVARATTHEVADDDFADVPLPDYAAAARAGRVVVDVITLDSAGCAPCQYMMRAAEQAAAKAGVPVEVHERKVLVREGVGFMTKLGVGNIPTICLNGKATFISEIPRTQAITDAIRRAAGT